jgi:hypothetical protein
MIPQTSIYHYFINFITNSAIRNYLYQIKRNKKPINPFIKFQLSNQKINLNKNTNRLINNLPLVIFPYLHSIITNLSLKIKSLKKKFIFFF